MNIFDKLVGSTIGTVVEKVGEAVDSLVTSDEEKLILKNKLISIQLESEAKARKDANEFEGEITKRWLSDNESQITKLVRPLSYIFILTLFGAIVLTDGNIGEFIIHDAYIPVIETLLVTMTVAYFGSRGIEKTTKIFNDKGK